MAMSNAERQARHRERIKEKLRNGGDAQPLRNDLDAREAGIEDIERLLLDEYYGVGEAWRRHLGQSSPSIDREANAAVETFLTEQVGFVDLIMMIREQAFDRINEFFQFPGADREMSWREHNKALRNQE
jgi:hypothetical protein